MSAQPDFVFHLAAQSLVRRSYAEPIETWQTNVLGTLHLLESLRALEKPCAAVLITSDKCYDNVEWVWGYRETDAMGGPVTAPLDTESDVAWIGYANRNLQEQVQPVLAELIEEYGLLPAIAD